MKTSLNLPATLALIAAATLQSAAAADLMIYPAKGQSAEQQEKDKFECYSWAKQQTGFDPMQMPATSTPPPQTEAKKGGVGRGALRGALGGALVGAVAGDTKKGAKIGAVGGGVVGGVRRSDQKRQEEHARQQWEQRETSQYMNNRQSYNRAYGACLEGRGYSVK
ncbi:MAG TPA: hypothetical protein ENK05_00280 [Gammaproteobacteria bacterium]|nr:hypothetical protein [Gammaproteobacteria bacterium]